METAGFAAAVNIIQLLDFSSKLISSSRELYKSGDGHLIEHSELRSTTESLSNLTRKVTDSLKRLTRSRKLSDLEKEQVRLGEECSRVASELLEVLENLKLDNKRTAWTTFRQVFLTLWNKEKIQSLERRLDRFRQELIANTLGTLRYDLTR
jgi:hypothetical protein